MMLRPAGFAIAACLAFTGAARAEELVQAAQAGDSARLAQLLESRADANQVSADSTSALHWAVYHDDLDSARRLIRAGAQAATRNDYGASPLSEAAVIGNPDMLSLLLDAGAEVNEANADGQTALMLVARTENLEAARILLDAGADVNARETWRGQTALMWAAHDHRPQMMRLLIEHGADVDARSTVNRWNRQTTTESRAQYRPVGGLTPLLFAAREGCLECARVLVDAGANIDLPDPEEHTPLLVALDNMYFDTAKYLLEAGADPNKWDLRGRTPLYIAIDMNMPAHGSGRFDRPSLDDAKPLEIARMLLDMGVEVDPQLKLRAPYRHLGDDRGTDLTLSIGATPLFRAAKGFDTEAINLLLEYGADPNLPMVKGVTPTTAAAGLASFDVDLRGRMDWPDIEDRSIAALEILIAAGGDINRPMRNDRRHIVLEAAIAPKMGQAALHSAAFWGWNDVVRFLVDNGADLFATDERGMSVVDAAMGRAGGNSRLGVAITEHHDTAALLEDLMAAADRSAGVDRASLNGDAAAQ